VLLYSILISDKGINKNVKSQINKCRIDGTKATYWQRQDNITSIHAQGLAIYALLAQNFIEKGFLIIAVPSSPKLLLHIIP
jgi:hypothetical protein